MSFIYHMLKIFTYHMCPVQTHLLSWLNIVAQYISADQQNANSLFSNKLIQGEERGVIFCLSAYKGDLRPTLFLPLPSLMCADMSIQTHTYSPPPS